MVSPENLKSLLNGQNASETGVMMSLPVAWGCCRRHTMLGPHVILKSSHHSKHPIKISEAQPFGRCPNAVIGCLEIQGMVKTSHGLGNLWTLRQRKGCSSKL